MITVLIVDDEELIRSSIKYALIETELDISVIGEAEDGEDAFVKYEQLMPDIVITDIKMPGMNGIQLIEEIRKLDTQTQIIIVSGYADFEFAQKALVNDVAQYVLKPIKTSELRWAFLRCMSHLKISDATTLNEGDKLVQYVKQNFTQPLTLDVLAKKFNFSPKYVSQLIKHKLGQGFSEYLLALRLRNATELLTKTDLDIKTIAQMVGYEDQQYFHRIFKRKTNKTPAQYRKNE